MRRGRSRLSSASSRLDSAILDRARRGDQRNLSALWKTAHFVKER
jgi:hypothetical protein